MPKGPGPMTRGTIFTERLELRPVSARFLQALYEGRLADAAGMEHVRLPENWEAGPQWVLRAGASVVTAVPGLAPWGMRIMVRRADNQVVGNIGLHYQPPGMHIFEEDVPGIVEFGYGVAPQFRRQGYAFEAAKGLMDWAITVHGVRDFQLEIALDNVPSQQLAMKLGFTQHGEYVHPFRGKEYLYRLRVE